MYTNNFWQQYEGEWPACEHPNCELPAVVGDSLDAIYQCAVHGWPLFIFQAGQGEWFIDQLDEVPWITIGEQ